jgi:maltose/moltooligosaccharide transporter
MQNKPRLSFWQIWNMSFGFLGIQFGWGLQLGNMSAIYEKLGAKPDELPLLWLAAPLTGLIIQPIIGAMSDRTWNVLGRRRPYFLVGAILASLALFVMPTSGTLWMAAGLLWILDASINITMEPFRAFVADKLNDQQRTTGFVTQSFFIGLGASLAGWLPLVFRYFGVTGDTESGIPLTIKYAFQLGAVAFLLAVLYTIFTTKEYPPENIEEFRREQAKSGGFFGIVKTIFHEIGEALRDIDTKLFLEIFQPHAAELHLQDEFANHPLFRRRAKRALDRQFARSDGRHVRLELR